MQNVIKQYKFIRTLIIQLSNVGKMKVYKLFFHKLGDMR